MVMDSNGNDSIDSSGSNDGLVVMSSSNDGGHDMYSGDDV